MRCVFLLPAFVLLFNCAPISVAADLSIHLSYPAWGSDNKPDSSTSIKWRMPDFLAVIVTNQSNKRIRIWSDRNSWGYDNVSFLATLENGEQIVISKIAKGWDSNWRSYLILKPREDAVFTANICDLRVWEWAPKGKKTDNSILSPDAPFPADFIFGKSQDAVIYLEPIFTIGKDDDSKNCNIWTGSIKGKGIRIKVDSTQFQNQKS